MVRFGGLLAVVALIFWLYCLFDVIATPRAAVRNLPKLLWVTVVALLSAAGGVLWLVAGRPRAGAVGRSSTPWPSGGSTGSPDFERPRRHRSRGPIGPDDDPEFLRRLNHRLRDDDGDDDSSST